MFNHKDLDLGNVVTATEIAKVYKDATLDMSSGSGWGPIRSSGLDDITKHSPTFKALLERVDKLEKIVYPVTVSVRDVTVADDYIRLDDDDMDVMKNKIERLEAELVEMTRQKDGFKKEAIATAEDNVSLKIQLTEFFSRMGSTAYSSRTPDDLWKKLGVTTAEDKKILEDLMNVTALRR